ncbi:MAG: hypothetical protein IPJ40_03515 [Saprospirales bacterium]|nr:hypothetical protein [Saprospirales bacterium]
MENTQNFKLVDGEFTPEKAREVLFSLVNSKIHFHNCEKFSTQIRFGGDVSHAEKRIEELTQVHQEIKELIEQAKAQGFNLKVNSLLEVALVEAEELEEIEAR